MRNDRFAALFLLELTTGIRRGQVCGLRWSAVDLESGRITVHDNRVVVGGLAVDKAGGKTRNADKTISIDPTTVAALQRWKEAQDVERKSFGTDYAPGDYVFTQQDGRPVHPDSIRQRFDRLAIAAGLPPDHLSRSAPFVRHRCAARRHQPKGRQRANRPRERGLLLGDLRARPGERRPRGRGAGRLVPARRFLGRRRLTASSIAAQLYPPIQL